MQPINHRAEMWPSHSKMKFSLVVLLLTAVACNAAMWGSDDEDSTALSGSFSLREARLASAATVSAMTGLEFIVAIYDASGYIGTGFTVNKYFALTLTNVVTGKTATDLKVYVGRLKPSDPAAADGVMRKGKAITHNVAGATGTSCSATGLVDCVSLVRVCPSFPTANYGKIPYSTAISTYQVTTNNVNMYHYQGAAGAATFQLYKLNKNIGEKCECMDIAGFLTSTHVCLAEDAVKKGENTDETKGVVITSSDDKFIVGFLVKQQAAAADGKGEVVLFANTYNNFITTQGAIAPYEY